MTATPPALLTSTLRLSPHVEMLLRTLKERLKEERDRLNPGDYAELVQAISSYCAEQLSQMATRGRLCDS